MASTDKTEYLGLNSWISTDIPARTDFVSDNVIIDTAIKNHIQDNSVHLSTEMAEKISSIGTTGTEVKIITYSGTGTALQTVALGCVPKFILVFASGKPPAAYESQVNKVYSAMAISGTSGSGAVIVGSNLKVYYNKTASAGIQYCLNESGVNYAVIVVYKKEENQDS